MTENIEILLKHTLFVVIIIVILAVGFYLVKLLRSLIKLTNEVAETVENVNDLSDAIVEDYDGIRKNLHRSDNFINMISLGLEVFESKRFLKKAKGWFKK
jgi:uncharacterized protein YoxC